MKNFIKRKIIEGFDEWSETYTDNVLPKLRDRGHGYNKLAEHILDALCTPKEAIVIELGTGTGVLGLEIKTQRSDLQLIGLDISEGMLKKALSTETYSTLIRCDAESIPVRKESINYIYTAFMFHSILHPRKSLSSIYNSLEKNGRLVVVDLFRISSRIPVLSNVYNNLHSIRHEHGAFSYYITPDELSKMAKEIGFNIVQQNQLGITKKYTHFSFVLSK